mmetsp:Transcript_25564/g.58378  ORF Transcript_25564/g.58378 Transcript_25564/m.58378 type:complete len:208 (-) Transcript_25564:37-660(-)
MFMASSTVKATVKATSRESKNGRSHSDISSSGTFAISASQTFTTKLRQITKAMRYCITSVSYTIRTPRCTRLYHLWSLCVYCAARTTREISDVQCFSSSWSTARNMYALELCISVSRVTISNSVPDSSSARTVSPEDNCLVISDMTPRLPCLTRPFPRCPAATACTPFLSRLRERDRRKAFEMYCIHQILNLCQRSSVNFSSRWMLW